jgi:hypothetical protein
MRIEKSLFLFALSLIVAFPRAATAHRLDEYLQATRISVARRHVTAEVSLTPGAAVAGSVISAIDRDRSGEISAPEGLAYAEGVVTSFSLEVDGLRRGLALDEHRIPSLAEMRRGEGVIRLRASAPISADAAGRHRLSFSNTHRSDIGVYLVNALVPEDSQVGINGQSRDMLQREFQMEYTVSENGDPLELAAVWPPVLGLSLAAALLAITRRFHVGGGKT